MRPMFTPHEARFITETDAGRGTGDDTVHIMLDSSEATATITGTADEVRAMLLDLLGRVETIPHTDPAHTYATPLPDPRVPAPFIRDVARVRGIDLGDATDAELTVAGRNAAAVHTWRGHNDSIEEAAGVAALAARKVARR